jgi:L-rhamnonate dehydratase
MSRWEKYRASRTSWGINVLGSFCVEIEGTDGTVGFATGFGGMMELARPQKIQD